MARRIYPFSNYEEFKKWLAGVAPCDEYGFRKATDNESIPEQIERLEYNLAVYREFMRNRSKFPPAVHEQRKWEFERLREIRKPIEIDYLNSAHRQRLHDMARR